MTRRNILGRRQQRKTSHRGKRTRRLRSVEKLEARRLLVGEVIEFTLSARTEADDEIAADVSGDINVEVGETFFLEVAYRDLREEDAHGAFVALVDVVFDDFSAVTPLLSESQRLDFDANYESATSGDLTFSFEGSSQSEVVSLVDFKADPVFEISEVLKTLGYAEGDFKIEYLDLDEPVLYVNYIGASQRNHDVRDLLVTTNFDVPSVVTTTSTPPVNPDGTINPVALANSLDSRSRAFSDNREAFWRNNRGSLDSFGFDEVGGLSWDGSTSDMNYNFAQPFDMFRVPVVFNQPVESFEVKIEPAEDSEAVLMLGRSTAVETPEILLDQEATLTFNAAAPTATANTVVYPIDSFGDGGDADLTDGIAMDANGNRSLRAAIEQANYTGGRYSFQFDFEGPGPHTIPLTSPLPAITTPVVIDGTELADYDGTPIVQLDGGGTIANGLRLQGGDSVVKGLSITGFTKAGIEIIGGGGNVISDNYLGLTSAGIASPNYLGTKVVVSADNTIRDNVISGNARAGVFITGIGSTGNEVFGNMIGTDPTGMTPIANGTDGVTVFASDNNIHGNLISGNSRWGVLVSGDHATGNVVRNNEIGVDATGASPLGNLSGVTLQSAGNRVESNVVSGNRAYGVSLSNVSASGNTLVGNLIGTDATGTADVGNGIVGIVAGNAGGNTIGGTGVGDGNVISGNDRFGILLLMDGSSENLVQGNKIGTDATGMFAVGNGVNGVRLVQGAKDNIFLENQIAGNERSGFSTSGLDTTGNDLLFNLIGTDATGAAPLHNGMGGAVRLTSPESEIVGNVISSPDIGVLGFSQASDLHIADNYIGTDRTEVVNSLGMLTAIRLLTRDHEVVGNRIANNQTGVSVGHTSTGVQITENSIYANSQMGIDLGDDGIANANDTGDADTGSNNLQNAPELAQAVLIGNQLTIDYAVFSTAQASTYRLKIEFFVSDAAGQGKTFIGSSIYGAAERYTVKTVSFDVTSLELSVGDQIVATATDAAGNTSEFSLSATLS